MVVLTKTDVGLGNVDNTSDANKPVSSAQQTPLNLKEDKANKGVVNGYASLDASGKVPVAQVPANLVTSVAGKQGVVTLVPVDVGLGNVDNTSDATKNSASATLTNKTINGANNTLTVRLASDVTGNLPVTNLNAGTGANSGSFWRGDGQWAPPAGGGDVVGPAGGVVDGEVVSYSGTTGKVLKATGGKLAASLVAGPASSVATNLATFTDTTGKLIGQLGKSGLATDFLNGTNAYSDLLTAVKPTIWSASQRNFNAVGNGNFEIDQRLVGYSPGAVYAVTNGGFNIDRWFNAKNGTMALNTQQLTAAIDVPGTTFRITGKVLRFTLTTAQASLGASDGLQIVQNVEGSVFRELASGVHSAQILARSSVANLVFALGLTDWNGTTVTRSLIKLCTMGAANTWTLIQLPNLPAWPFTGSNLSTEPGAASYRLGVTLAAGSSSIAPAAGTWQTGAYSGVAGMSNFANQAVNSTFDLAFVQHEPGAECTALMDVPFAENLRNCQRYYCKSYPYKTSYGTPGYPGMRSVVCLQSSYPDSFTPFPVPMCTIALVTAFNPQNGSQNSVYDYVNSIARGTTGTLYTGESGFCGFSTSSTPTAVWEAGYHFTADTFL